jgi:hypothetical protein
MNEITIKATGEADVVSASNGSLNVTIPIKITRRGRRKAVTLPDGTALQPRAWDNELTQMQQALVRGLSMAGHPGVGQSTESRRGGRDGGDGQGLPQPDGEPHHSRAGHRGCHLGRVTARPRHLVRSGIGDAITVGRAAGTAMYLTSKSREH